MSAIQGVVVGLVKEVDPGLGKLKVSFPWLQGDVVTYWARVATMMAGKDRGSWFMPEVGDEVLVAFEHGDPQLPYVIGYLWSEVDTPPVKDDAIDQHVRRLRTVKNHRIDFDDRDNKERIYIQSHGKHLLEMNDFNGPFINIETPGKRHVKIDDQAQKIEIKTTDTQSIAVCDQDTTIDIENVNGLCYIKLEQDKITINMGVNQVVLKSSGISVTCTGTLDVTCNGSTSVTANGALDITAAGATSLTAAGAVSATVGGALSVTAASASITAGVFSVSAPIATFSGVLQATTIVASVYTPGVGNLI